MFEVKKDKDSRSLALRLFVGLPWVVRAFLNLFIILLLGVLVFSILGKIYQIPAFDKVSEELTSFLKFVIGAIVGSLSREAKEYLQRKKPDEVISDNRSDLGEN